MTPDHAEKIAAAIVEHLNRFQRAFLFGDAWEDSIAKIILRADPDRPIRLLTPPDPVE